MTGILECEQKLKVKNHSKKDHEKDEIHEQIEWIVLQRRVSATDFTDEYGFR